MTALAFLLLLPLLPLSRITDGQLAWARDRWLLGVILLALVTLATVEPFLVLVAVAALAQWRGPEQMPSIIVYAAIIGMWLLVAQLPPTAKAWLPLGFTGVALVHSGAILAQAVLRRPLRGLLGQKTHSAGALALTLPFCGPWALATALLGLLVAQSWLAWLAAAGALTMLWPWAGFLVLLAGLVLMVPPTVKVARLPTTYHRPPSENTWLDRVSTRGTSIDSFRARLAAWRVLASHLSWRGLGPGAGQALITRSAAPSIGHAHNEPLEYLCEYGGLGLLALGGLIWRVAPHLKLADPWSAAVVAGVILMLASTPARLPQVGGLWWAQVAILGAP